MTASSTSGSLTFRARRFPVWICFGIVAFQLLIVLIVALAAWPHAGSSPRSGQVGLVIVIVLILAGPTLLIFKIGNDLRRLRISLDDDGVDLRLNRFSVWSIRRSASARLAWRDVHGVQRYEIPNVLARGGTQVDYVLHTSQGVFVVSSIQFTEAERIAELVNQRIGRTMDDLPAGTTPVTADTPSGRRGVRLMRALGWVSQAAGVVALAFMSLAWALGEALDPGTIGAVAMTSGVLLMLGRALRAFSLK